MRDEEFTDALRDAVAAAAPHLVAAGRELIAAANAFLTALKGETPVDGSPVRVDVEVA